MTGVLRTEIDNLGKIIDVDKITVLPHCNEATFYDNDNGFVTVAKYKNGELQPIGKNSPKWLKELIEKMN